jgi:HSP20 family molecular chaperone IbpA
MKKIMFISTLSFLILSGNLHALGLFDIDINQQIQYNEKLISQYEEAIKELKTENKQLLEEVKKHPELYVKKSLYEDLKDKYIYRVKLNGAKADKLNLTIKDNFLSIVMDMKSETKSDKGYYFNSQHFSTTYSIPQDVIQDKISHRIDGDYFVVEMPKKVK